mgnify:FL=1
MRRRSGFGWMELIVGILLILLGIFTLFSPGSALTGVVILYGILAVITGIADVVLYVKMERFVGLGPSISLVSGILSIMSGLALLAFPEAGKWIFSLLFPIWFIAHCISRLMNLGMIRLLAGKFRYYLALILNILGLILGFLMLFQPFLSALSISFIIAVYLILLGAESIAMASGEMGSDW